MRTIDGFWRPGSKKAESLLSDIPSDEEKEAFVIAKLDEVFKNQVGHFVVFKAEMLDHILTSIDEDGDGTSKKEFSKAYYKTYESLGGALKIRRMGFKSMHMSHKHLHRGFSFWLFQNKYALTVMWGIMALNTFIFDFNDTFIKCLGIFCSLTIIMVLIRSWYVGHIKLKKIDNTDLILSTYRHELQKVFAVALTLCNFPYLKGWLDIHPSYLMCIVMPLTYILSVYHFYIEANFNDLTSNNSIKS